MLRFEDGPFGYDTGILQSHPARCGEGYPRPVQAISASIAIQSRPAQCEESRDEGRNGGSVGERISILPRRVRGVVTGIPLGRRLASRTFNSTL
jgi:hypothetical protein